MAQPKYPLLTETVVNLIRDYLQANFNAALTDIDNQYSDGISLEKVNPSSIYISDAFQSLQLPAIYILFEEHAFQYTNDPNYLESDDKCVIVLSADQIGQESLTRKMWRYARVLNGLLNLLDLHDAQNRLNIRLMVQRVGYTATVSDKVSREQSRFRKDCVIELQIKHYENFLTA